METVSVQKNITRKKAQLEVINTEKQQQRSIHYKRRQKN